MGKKTNKLIYVILGILAILFFALIPFSVFRRKQLLAEGDMELADFSITMGIIGLVGCLIFCGIIFLLLMKDRRTEAKLKLFQQELGRTPLFARWLSNEETQLKAKLRAPRIFTGVLSISMIWCMLLMLYLILDETDGVLGVYQWIALLFCLFVFWFTWWISDYRKQYMRSILRSVSEQLPSDAEKEAFGAQLSRIGVINFSYSADPQSRASTAWVTEEYSYFRQLQKCRIIKNRYIDKVTLKKAPYMIGFRPHFRTCYTMEIAVNGGRERAWRGYFRRQEDLYYALNAFRRYGLADEKIEDQLQKSTR
ncbi:MAG: hypothetical protein HDQ98_07040 [Lachnospiraceae bacterium]|nr:hypothetical protein [Lachnospiraceae bacterium]